MPPNWYDEMLTWDGQEAEFEIHRETIQEGRTFSAEAMAGLDAQLMAWVGTRIMRRWDTTNEPPTVVRVSIVVDVR